PRKRLRADSATIGAPAAVTGAASAPRRTRKSASTAPSTASREPGSLMVGSRPESAHRRTVSSLTPSSEAASLMRYVGTPGTLAPPPPVVVSPPPGPAGPPSVNKPGLFAPACLGWPSAGGDRYGGADAVRVGRRCRCTGAADRALLRQGEGRPAAGAAVRDDAGRRAALGMGRGPALPARQLRHADRSPVVRRLAGPRATVSRLPAIRPS